MIPGLQDKTFQMKENLHMLYFFVKKSASWKVIERQDKTFAGIEFFSRGLEVTIRSSSWYLNLS